MTTLNDAKKEMYDIGIEVAHIANEDHDRMTAAAEKLQALGVTNIVEIDQSDPALKEGLNDMLQSRSAFKSNVKAAGSLIGRGSPGADYAESHSSHTE